MFLTLQASRRQTTSFAIPFSREELAAYLCVNRSALSRELGRMQRDGLVETWHGSFKILDKTGLQGSAREATL